MSKKRKVFDFARKWGRKLALAGVLFHGATQLNYTRNDISNAVSPSPIRSEFKEKFGFPIRGWEADIEKQENFVTNVSDAVHREKTECDFDLSCIRVDSRNYLKRNLLDQFGDLFLEPYAGVYVPKGLGNKIGLNGNVGIDTLHHEIKHRKAFKYCDSDFYKKWKALATDENGNSLYNGQIRTGLGRIKLLGKLFRSSTSVRECEEQGFVSDYARSNVDEDIAETCMNAESNPEKFTDWFFGFESYEGKVTSPNQKIIGKVRLAQEKKLIPKEFEEYIALKRLEKSISRGYYNGWGTDGEHNRPEDYVTESKKFLDKHSNSVYECPIRQMRAWCLKSIGLTKACHESAENDRKGVRGTYEKLLKEEMQPVITEYKRALTAEYKEGVAYACSLNGLSEVYEHVLRDSKTAEIIEKADKVYYDRHHKGDVQLSYDGVNNYLESHGISLDTHENRALENICGGNK